MNSINFLLNKIKWTSDLKNVTIWYYHHGAPQDTRILHGGEIKTIGYSFLETQTVTIPYHRIQKIQNNDTVLFDRNHKKNMYKIQPNILFIRLFITILKKNDSLLV